jgi:hypothetical protein
VAQLYGLAGLRLVAPERFAALAPSYRSQAASVRTFRACSGGERAFSDVLGPASSKATVWDISSGSWARDLAGLPPGPNPGVQRTRFARR